MNVRVEAPSPCRRKIHIEVPIEKVRAMFDEVTSQYAAFATVPGFRPGRAPKDLVRMRYRKDIASDVKERLMPEAYKAAIKQENLTTVSVLDVSEKEIDESRPFEFSVTVDVAPDFALPSYKGIPLHRREPRVEESEVENVLLKVRQNAASYTDIAGRPVQPGDFVQIDYDGVCEGRPIQELVPKAVELGSARDFWMLLDEKTCVLPGFVKGLCGASIGERREIAVDFPADFAESALAGRTALYFVTVKAIREPKVPELDAEFCKSHGMESPDDFRKRVREDLLRLKEMEENRRLKSQIIRHLLDNTSCDLPESMLQEEARLTVHDLVQEYKRQGATPDDLQAQKDDLIETATRTAVEKVKLKFILRRIAEEEQIKVEEREVDDHISQLARSWRIPVNRLRADLEKNNSMDDVREGILQRKVIDFLLNMAAITPNGAAA
jgi:trigger factor